MSSIEIRGARTHNLKNINVDLPRDQLIVITGPSGSGKSSLAFDTLYAEGQRRYVESLSSYARQFLSMMEKPDVDHINGLSPAISIEQKTTSHNPRSTVGTITEIYDYLRLLFARVGQPQCPTHHTILEAQTVSQMVDQILTLPQDTKLMILAPVVNDRKGEHQKLLEDLLRQGYVRARIDGEIYELDDAPKLDLRKKHSIEAVIDRVKVRDDLRLRLTESLDTALALGKGLVRVAFIDSKEKDWVFSAKFACTECGYSIEELEPRLFSFNNPAGACAECDGLGVASFIDVGHVVRDVNLSLAEGAIRGWDRRHHYFFQMLESLAKHYKFDLEKPYKNLSKRVQQILLYGSDETEINFRYYNERGTEYTRKQTFEGVIPNMERRYHETDSETVRAELAKFLGNRPCPACAGTRLRVEARHVFIAKTNLPEICRYSIVQSFDFFSKLQLTGKRREIADKILKEVCERLQFLMNVGLEYITLERSAETLSGGEAQRIRLASQIGAGLVGVMYVLDEPTIGLHQRDNERLLKTLVRLRDLGNTVIVVEHDEETMHAADFIIDMGPGAGIHGGEVVATGAATAIMKNKKSATGDYLSGRKQIAIPSARIKPDHSKLLTITGASGNNLKNVSASFPIGLMTVVTGVSGSGKSTLVNDTLFPAVSKQLSREFNGDAAPYSKISGIEFIDKIVDIDQSPIGRTPRSNPATYTGIFTPIRELFAGTQEARSRGYQLGRFSFNVRGGRCEACQGDGLIRVEMHFLPDIFVPCDVCHGARYNRETLDIHYKGKSILDVLNMNVETANEFFSAVPPLAHKLQTLIDVGLDYITLGQNATTLSGGEAQRIKLARELSKRDTGKTLYILDEPTTGLHFQDIEKLLTVLNRLKSRGNTIVVIEHNLDVIKTADWIIDLGPEGGDAGGQILVFGSPEDVAKHKASHTARFLRKILAK